MKKSISISVLFVCLMVVFSSLAFGQAQSAEDLKALNAKLEMLFHQGDYSAALSDAKKLQIMVEQRYPDGHVERANALNYLIIIYIEKGDYIEAEKLAYKALDIYEKLPGKERLCAAMIYGYLEEIYKKTDRPDEEKEAHCKKVEIQMKAAREKVTCGAMKPLEVMGPEDTSPEAVSAFWNTWFEDVNKEKRVTVLEAKKSYTFALDISRFSYFEDSSECVDPSIRNRISDARERKDTKIQFTIRPILQKVLSFVGKQDQSPVLTVEINKLVRQKDPSVEKKYSSQCDKIRRGLSEPRPFSKEVGAGKVEFQVRADEPGDATISISVWDESGMIPLDHLTLSVQVIDPTVPGKRSAAVKTFPLKAGWGTLLDVALDFSSAGPLVADAAFYIFEPAPGSTPEGNSMVLFAVRKAKTGTEVSDQKQDISVYAWKTKSLLSRYLEDENGFFAVVEKARADSSYQSAAEQLKKKFFTEFDDNIDGNAAKALTALQTLVSQKEGAIVFVRMRNEKGAAVYPPLGILAASSKTRILKNKIILVQPLPRERYPAGKSPVETWTFAIPRQLSKLTTPIIVKALETFKEPKDARICRDITALRGFFETIVPPPSDSKPKPEGILVLAHHGGGKLWFTENDKKVEIEDIKHSFAPGSIAILSACSAAAAENNNQAILRDLNKHNIDAMIISPFPVDLGYGTMLAIHFTEILESARTEHKRPTIAELFVDAAEKTAKYFKENMNLEFKEVDLEFLIAGDYRIVAAPEQKTNAGGGLTK